MAHYGENGAGFYFGDRPYSVWYNDEGIRVSSGESVRRSVATLLTWEDAARRIRELLELGRYMPQNEIDRAPEYGKAHLADDLLYMYRDIDGDNKDAYFLSMKPAYELHGGFPEMSAAVKELLEQPDALQTLVDECRAFIDAYEQDTSILRFRYRSKELLQRLTDLQREPLTFTATEGYDPQRRFFISGDELDQVLRGSTEYRLAVYSFYRNNPDRKEREKFLKNYHGEYSGYHGGNDNRTYTSKGLSFSHGSLTRPYAKIELSWSKIERRVSALIASGKFISEEDRAAMPAYEKHQLARQIQAFFDGVPQDQPKPYPYGVYFTDAIKVIESQLDDPAKVEEIYQMMLPVWESTTQDDRSYAWRKRGFENLSAFRAGTFTLFGEVKQPKPVQEVTAAEQPAPVEVTPDVTPRESDVYRDLAAQLLRFYQEFDPYDYRSSMNLGETDEDALEMLSREIFTPDHYVFYQKDGGYHDFNDVQEYLYNALPLFFRDAE